MLFRSTGTEMVHVPYKGGAGPAAVGLVGAETQVMFSTLSSVISFVKANRLKGLAVTSKERLAQLPEVPTMVESGVAGFDVSSWYGLFMPGKTPPEASVTTPDMRAVAVWARAAEAAYVSHRSRTSILSGASPPGF